MKLVEPLMEKYTLSGRNQFGFTKGRGARDAVAYLTLAWISALNGHCKIGLYCSVVSGAFDRVDSEILLQKLRRKRFHPKLVQLLSSWLRERVGHVLVNGEKSKGMRLKDIISKGQSLGPNCGTCSSLMLQSSSGVWSTRRSSTPMI